MSNQTYTVGQAVIYNFVTDGEQLVFIDKIDNGLTFLVDFHGNEPECSYISRRPATQSEILAEAVKHGWDLNTQKVSLLSPKRHMVIVAEVVWTLPTGFLMEKPKTFNLKEYCEEGLVAHRLITALNLVK